MGNPAAVAARRRRRRSPQRKHFRESMAAKGVLCFVLISALATLATSLPGFPGYDYDYDCPKLCECINPFSGTSNGYRGNPDNLCGDDGPGQCYVPCDADCSDIQPAASSARCFSKFACGVWTGRILAYQPGC